MLLAVVTSAQEVAPKRGFAPGSSFALSDIESINTTNGNLMMHFPLGSLPAGRNGLTAGITLVYSSKLYNSRTAWFRDWGRQCQESEEQSVCPHYQTNTLERSVDGGWRYAMGYSLEIVNRLEDGAMPPNLRCVISGFGTAGNGYLPMTYIYKLKIHFPDGSVHEMRPNGFTDQNTEDVQSDYYNVRPDGWISDCLGNGHWHTNTTMSYYSTDGSYLRLDVPRSGGFTLYAPDGTRVESPVNGPQRIYDRNNNYVEIGGNQIRDQFGRTITLGSDSATGEDTITQQGFGETLVWKVRWKTIGVYKTYWPCPGGEVSCQTDDTGSPNPNAPVAFYQELAVVDRITLPAQAGNLTYSFTYNAPEAIQNPPQTSAGWGELSGITLPSGAHAAYQYHLESVSDPPPTRDVLKNFPTRKDLTYNQEYDGTNNEVTETWEYASSTGGGYVTSPDGGISTDYAFANPDTAGWQPWNAGLVYKSVHPDGSMSERIWAKNNLSDYCCGVTARGDNPYVKTEFTSIKNAAGNYVKTAIRDYNYDKNGNVTRVAEYDWLDYANIPRDSLGMPTGVPVGAVPSRITTNSYYADTADATQVTLNGNVYWFQSSPQWKNALALTEVSDGAGNIFARTEFSYDNASTTGNLTQKTTWDSNKGGYSNPLTPSNSISVSSEYTNWSNGATGKLIQTTDPRGTITRLTYGSVGGFDLYPTQIQSAYNTSIQRTEARSYDFGTGLVMSVTDSDNNVTTSTTYDVFGRPTMVKLADGKPEETRTATEYSDTARRVIVRSDLNTLGDGKLVSIQHYDQLGRVRLTRQLEDSTTQSATDESAGIKVQTRYAFSGSNSYALTSNPYRAATSGAATSEATMGWTRSKSDNGGRVIEVQTFGGSSPPGPWGSNATSTGTVTTAYDANFTTVTDQALRVRRSMTNGLGQLARVDEPGDPNVNNSLGATDNPAQPTSYAYDVLGNLTNVYQGSQTRTFSYSSLARLTSASNPESGTVGYQYDNNGNLTQKIDPRLLADNITHVTTTYVYDALNRVISRSYNDGTAPNYTDRTPAVTYNYDTATNGKGRLASFSSSVSTYSYSGYDALGQPLGATETIGSQSYSISNVSYDLAGHIKSMNYPSGHSVAYAYDGAGRMNSFNGYLGDGTQRTYSTGITYSSLGGLQQEQFGTQTPLYHKLHYNVRGQLNDIRVSTVAWQTDQWNWDRGATINYYSTADLSCQTNECRANSGAGNNGNLLRQESYIPGSNFFQDNFGYDSLNRLTSIAEKLNGTGNDTFKQSYAYDRFGNRLIDTDPAKAFGAGINNKSLSVNTANNRLTVPSGQSGTMHYDAAGNLDIDTYSAAAFTRLYDGENRMTKETQANSYDAGIYSYDGDGHRVKRKVGGTETWQVYGLRGELIAEYAQNGSPTSPQKEYGYRNGELLITAEAATRTNVALALNGATATAQNYTQDGVVPGSHFYPSYAIDGQRYCHLTTTDADGFWRDEHGLSSWLQVDFNGAKTIDEVDVFTTRDNYLQQSDPSAAQTFTSYGTTSFEVQYLNGATWTTVPGGSVTGNNSVWRKISFAALTTAAIRIKVNAASDGVARIDEVEAWGGAALVPAKNLAAASNGATATAQNYTQDGVVPGSHFYTSYAIDGQRSCHLTTSDADGFWRDEHGLPSWLEVDLAGTKIVHEIDVYTVRDDYLTQGDPNSSQTFSSYGTTSFEVQYWNGAGWVTVPGGLVTANGLVWRKISFPAVSTTKIRVRVNAAADGVARLTEVEAWGYDTANIHWLVTDQLGTPRMVFDQSGSLTVTDQNGNYVSGMTRHDYLPFGEEVPANFRTGIPGYSANDNVRQKFTQKERDNETGLDYFLARYYASTQGRFTSVDPVNLTRERLIDPQQINLYQYTRNDPLNLLDPTGETIDFEKDSDGNLTKNGKLGKEAYDNYREFLSKDKNKYASELATLTRLEGSKINYVIAVTTKDVAGGGEAEGLTSTDGKNILVTIRNRGNGHEKFTIEGRFAHELEHARQFDKGEFHFVRTATKVWAPYPKTYDIYDEVRAFKAQLDVTPPALDTSMLSTLRDDRLTDSDRASVLRSSYPKRNQKDTNVTYLWGAKSGEIVRPNAQHPDVFGVVH